MNDMIYVGIITYNPDITRLKQNIETIIAQCTNLVLVDNGSNNLTDIFLLESFYDIEVISLEKNFGIAKALNVLMSYGKENHFDWVLSLDQDSIVADNIIEQYLKYIFLENIAALCPCMKKMGLQNKEESIETNDYYEIERCPTTGFFL